MKVPILLFLTIFTVSLYAQQGIKGTVTWVSGNQMPGPNKLPSQPKKITREIHIYRALSLNEVQSIDGVFFSEIKAPLIKKIKTRKNGSFCVKLPPGEYSVFTKEVRGLFANSFDSQSRIQCIVVERGQFSRMTIQVNYEAAY